MREVILRTFVSPLILSLLTISSQDQENARRHATPNGWLSVVSCQPWGAEQVMFHSGHLQPGIIEYFYQQEAVCFLYRMRQPAIKPRVSLSPACITASLINWGVALHFTSEEGRQISRTVSRGRGMETHSPATSPEAPPRFSETQSSCFFITDNSAHKTSRKTAGDDSRNPQMRATCSALGMLGDSQPETSPQICRGRKHPPKAALKLLETLLRTSAWRLHFRRTRWPRWETARKQTNE